MRKACAACGLDYEAKRATSKFCSSRCRQRGHRQPGEVHSLPSTPVEASEQGALERSTLAELEAAGRESSSAGQAAVALARRIDGGQAETGSSMAALVREYRASLADAVKDAESASDPLDELRNRRERKLASG